MENICFHVITINQNKERAERIKTLFSCLNAHYQFKYKIHYFDAIKPSWKGCLLSHLSLVRYAKRKKLPYILICEDNLVLARPYEKETFQNLFNFINNNTSWDVVYLGGVLTSIWQGCQKTEEQIYRTYRCHGTQVYFLSSRFYDRLLTQVDRQVAIDYNYVHLARQYIYNPFLFYRSHNLQSTINSHLDLVRIFAFHPTVFSLWEKVFFHQDIFKLVLIILGLIIIWTIKNK